MSAELALELLDDDLRERVVLCPAPLVEGLVVAAVAAAGGASSEEVAAEAAGALAGKIGHLGTSARRGFSRGGRRSDELTGSFVVANPHGLHARPAARLVQEVRRRDAHARIRNRRTESEWVDAGSLSKIATLGVRSGDEVEVRVSGSQAAETLDHILSLAARNFDESPVEAAPPPEPTVRHAPIGAGPGLGIGPARSMRLGAITIPDAPADEPAVEWRRLGKAIASVRRTISQLRTRTAREVGEAEASIFDAHQLLLDDAALLDDVRGRIDSGQSAVSAWSAAVQKLAAEFAAVPDPYLQARADDVRAVGDQVLRAMLGTGESFDRTHGRACGGRPDPGRGRRAGPRRRVAAVLLAFGSPHAHNVILLRAKGIPVIVGAGPSVLSIPDGTIVAVDGGRGEFVVDPHEEVPCRSFTPESPTLAQRQQPGARPCRRARGHPRRRYGCRWAQTSARWMTRGRRRPMARISRAWCAPSSCSSAARTRRTSRSSSRSTARSPNRLMGGESRCAPWMLAVTSHWSSCRRRPR